MVEIHVQYIYFILFSLPYCRHQIQLPPRSQVKRRGKTSQVANCFVQAISAHYLSHRVRHPVKMLTIAVELKKNYIFQIKYPIIHVHLL